MSNFRFAIKKLNTVDSTNSYALANIDMFTHNTLVYSDIQTSGRGRLNRKWISDTPENLYCSVIIKPDQDYKKLPLVNFTQFFCVILAEIINDLGVTPQIKWPNDILVNEKKIAGILSESSFTGSSFNGIVVGIGLNIGALPKEALDREQAVTSLYEECGRDIDREEIIQKIAELYSEYYDLFCETGFSAIRDSYLSFFPFIGKEVSIENGTVNVTGIVVDVSPRGELIIDNGSEGLQNIVLGDMVWKALSRA
ncbi:MAG: biotin--[acetyl-CoA-carboxylase] ligase [Spirochaetes bacterium]|nr:biotin--[acetyl-CoA-carboxylase] ligase [Spirochaetota bacterium]MBN2769958.1 biotin--[acetyl-CoA-carboxylase] ligase [Spirochaetota bacterium]